LEGNLMNENDPPNPFAVFESDRTVIKPSAGRGSRATRSPAATSAPVAANVEVHELPDLPQAVGLNPLVQAAAPLLVMAPRLRAMARHPDPAGLHASLVDAVKRFEASVRASGVPNEQVIAARYVLCTLIDEAAASTPWGGSGAWAAQSLLVQFHGESWGGEKVFQLLTKLAENPTQNRNLLEFVYMAMALGFEGRYRVLDKGREQLDSVRVRLAQMVRQGAVSSELSTQWQGQVPPTRRLRDGVPIWVMATVLAVLLAVTFMVLRLSLNAQTDTAFSALQSLGAQVQVAPVARPVAAPEPVQPRLSVLLASDIQARKIEVIDRADRSIVTIQGDGMFSAGSGEVQSDYNPLLARIGTALAQVPGAVVIRGHTDSVPIRSLQFPSNWHLSKARSLSVRDLLTEQVETARMRVEGRAETEPVADNATAEGRARNRRVEIVLTPTATNDAGGLR
jgi:type VI secretion system protein ImpK